MSRENTYSQLLEAVTNTEKDKEGLKIEIEKLSTELQAKRLELDGLVGKGDESGVYALEKEVSNLEREEQNLLEKYQKCSIVKDQLHNWVSKIYNVLLSVLEKSDKHPEEVLKLKSLDKENTEQMFLEMCQIIEKLVDLYGHLEGDKKVTIKGLASQDNYFIDEAYQLKNIRVKQTAKPVLRRSDSGKSSRSSSQAPATVPTGNAEAEKEQREINSEFRDERKKRRNEIKKTVNI